MGLLEKLLGMSAARTAQAANTDPKHTSVAGWLKDNTFHHSQFSNLDELIQLKEKAGVSISLCIPSLNEEKTIGKEIVLFKSELMSRKPLVDEIAVVDSGSTDRTCEIAAEFGADVYLSSDILPSYGSKRGKGENLWKAVYQLKGDIIVYVDADIGNIHPRFVYGLLGPLLRKPDVKYVKAFYERPLAFSKSLTKSSGGGRVTEVLVRPLFSLFFPELTAIIQPLSGEYAVRREVLEKLWFPVGYGVETSHLIDVYRMAGLGAFAQTDLDQRVHRNQPTQDLGRMSFGILQTFFTRMQKEGLMKELPNMATVMRQYQVHDGAYEPVEFDIVEDERPPMGTIPEYKSRRRGAR